jgi:hypothetical protein
LMVNICMKGREAATSSAASEALLNLDVADPLRETADETNMRRCSDSGWNFPRLTLIKWFLLENVLF